MTSAKRLYKHFLVPVVLYHGTKEERAVMRKLHFKRKSRNDPLPVVCPSPPA